MNIVSAARNLKLVNKTLKAWMTKLYKAGLTNDVSDDGGWEIMFKSYVDIMKTFEIHEKTFHRQVGYFIFQNILYSRPYDIGLKYNWQNTSRKS